MTKIHEETIGIAGGTVNADEISFTPAGDIAATDVQGAIEEVDDEKLAKLLAAFTVATELTIAAGAVTITQSMHKIDTQADGASDDLDTINGGSEGALLIIRAEHTDRTIVLKDSTGNLDLWTGDIELDETNKYLILTYDETLLKWIIAGGAGLNVVSDAVYGTGWNGVMKRAPSKNSVYDEMEKKVERITSVDNEIARFDSTGGDVQGYTSNAPTVSDEGLADFSGGLKVADPTDEHGVGDRGFNDGRYLAFDEIIQAASDTLTVAEVKGMQISNYGQGAANNLQGLPTAAKGMSFAAVCGTAQAAHYFRFQAAANDKFYLDGVAGSDNGSVSIAVPVVGATIYFFTFQTGATTWDWYASTIAGNWVAV